MASPSPETLDSTLGAIFLGNLAAAILYGITSVQAFVYFKTYPSDRRALKRLIAFLWTLDTVHTAFLAHSLYFYCVSNFSNRAALQRGTWSIWSQVYITCIIELAVRGVFIKRVWFVSHRNIWVVAITTPLALIHCVGGLYLGSRMFQLERFHELRTVSATTWYLSFACGVTADAVIAASLVTALFKLRTGFQRTDRMVATLMVYAINTGLLTSLWGLVCLITFAVLPNDLIYLGVFFVIPKLSLNALLATLNARRELRDESSSGINTVPVELGGFNDNTTAPVHSISGKGSDDAYGTSRLVITVERSVEISGCPSPDTTSE